jgi:predicted DNA-binding transcriptional regulator AlpA
MTEAVAVSGLSKSKLYLMICRGELEVKQFGRSRRITWASIRSAFLSSEVR